MRKIAVRQLCMDEKRTEREERKVRGKRGRRGAQLWKNMRMKNRWMEKGNTKQSRNMSGETRIEWQMQNMSLVWTTSHTQLLYNNCLWKEKIPQTEKRRDGEETEKRWHDTRKQGDESKRLEMWLWNTCWFTWLFICLYMCARENENKEELCVWQCTTSDNARPNTMVENMQPQNTCNSSASAHSTMTISEYSKTQQLWKMTDYDQARKPPKRINWNHSTTTLD